MDAVQALEAESAPFLPDLELMTLERVQRGLASQRPKAPVLSFQPEALNPLQFQSPYFGPPIAEMSAPGLSTPREGSETSPKTNGKENRLGTPENAKFRSITELWAPGQTPTASQVAKECLSCDRWAGTTVAGGGIYLLWKSRQAPTRASAILMVGVGGIMAIGGIYQGWINHYFTVRCACFLIPPRHAH